ncbi:hypothetical protein NWE61_05310 [Mycoplasmopsis felis]|nr:hypothetical protein [Mycoplasmopsis felis]MCU9934503.1 hypothetical protein [Mycoplasmopsis felis]
MDSKLLFFKITLIKCNTCVLVMLYGSKRLSILIKLNNLLNTLSLVVIIV